MLKGYWSLIPLAAALAGCNTVGGITVRDYTAASGQRVMAGQAEPKREYQCQKLGEEEHDWGMKESMNKAAAIEMRFIGGSPLGAVGATAATAGGSSIPRAPRPSAPRRSLDERRGPDLDSGACRTHSSTRPAPAARPC